MKVKTLHPKDLQEACNKIERYFNDFQPDLIIGIANGGWLLSQKVFPQIPHYKIVCQRPTTRKKEGSGFIKKLIRHLPEWTKNMFRIIESKLLSKKKATREIKCDFSFSDLKDKKILVIDDAVDSGNTLECVIKKIEEETTAKDIKSGVITTTTPMPLVKPTMSVFNNILIRFPWSIDYKAEK